MLDLLEQPNNQPLSNARWEAFCVAMARPAPPHAYQAYLEATETAGKPLPNEATARVAASVLLRKQVISERIVAIREDRLRAAHHSPEMMTERRIHELLAKCTETLIEATEAAQAAGMGAAALSALRKSILTHENRRIRAAKHIEPEPTEKKVIELKPPHWCTCTMHYPETPESRTAL